jgi:PhnB protein
MPERPQINSLSIHLICKNAADAIEFYKRAFGATEMMRLPDKDGLLMHAAVSINGSTVMLMDEYLDYGARSPKTLGGTPAIIHLMVPDADAAFDKAIAAGATPVMPVADMFWGDRYGQVEDPFGHRWSIATPVKQLTPEEIQENLRKMEQNP